LLERRERLTPSDHQSHRRYPFEVPDGCTELTIRVRYTPKFLSAADSARLVRDALGSQRDHLASRVGAPLAERWSADFDGADLIVPNLLTVSLDDAAGSYRGAAHRQNPDQELSVGLKRASPGLVAGPIPPGAWSLTLSAHTLVTDHCEVEIQIGAVTAAMAP
jgi:hypothetical protein